jgi:diamine N-acetyltransferase
MLPFCTRASLSISRLHALSALTSRSQTSDIAMSTVNVRLATVTDSAELSCFAGDMFALTFGHLYPTEVTAKFLETDYTESIYSEWIQDSKYGVWVATASKCDSTSEEMKDTIIGYCVCGSSSLPRTESCSGEVKKLYVDKANFGNGLANKLFETGVSWIRESYARHPIYISVYSENFRAIKFYNRYNFAKHDEYVYVVGECRDREFILKEVDSSAGSIYSKEIVA